MRIINADAAIDALNTFADTENGNKHFIWGINTAKEIIENAPTIEPPQGEWIEEKFFLEDDPEYERFRRVCSVCGWEKTIGTGGTRYCPRCGMKGGE